MGQDSEWESTRVYLESLWKIDSVSSHTFVSTHGESVGVRNNLQLW